MIDHELFTLYLRAGDSVMTASDLTKLAWHQNPLIRCRVAENPGTPTATLVTMIGDMDHSVRCALAENPAIPEYVLQILAEDEHEDVRYAIADNPHTPQDIRAKLTLDSNCYIAHRARTWFEKIDRESETIEMQPPTQLRRAIG